MEKKLKKLIRSRLVLPNGKHVGADCPNCVKLLNKITDVGDYNHSIEAPADDQGVELELLWLDDTDEE